MDKTKDDPIFICSCGGTYKHKYSYGSPPNSNLQGFPYNPLICNKCKWEKDDDK